MGAPPGPSAVSALLDPARLRVAGALVDTPLTIDALVTATALGRRTVLEAVGVLRQAGLVEAVEDRFSLPAANLREVAASWADVPIPMDPSIAEGMGDDEREVLARFFRGRTLVEIPASRPRRRVVLERLALEFEPGRHYAERQVNEVLRAFHPDVATLRRHLVDEDLLDRDSTSYWRSGGRYEP